MTTPLNFKKHISLPSLLETTRNSFKTNLKEIDCIDDKSKISTLDCLMSAVAMFSLKSPSLLRFDKSSRNTHVKQNLTTLFNVSQAPSDTYMRERIDSLDPLFVRKAFTAIFGSVQRAQGLKPYLFHDDRYLISIDVIEYFSSNQVHCKNCFVKNPRNGTKTYSHETVTAVMIHPDLKTVIPFCPEPILKEDGDNKNECKSNAAKRLIADIRREHPHLDFIAVQDALSANGPHIKFLKENNVSFIIEVTDSEDIHSFNSRPGVNREQLKIKSEKDEKIQIELNFYNDVSINESCEDIKVNFLQCKEYTQKEEELILERTFTWITDLELTQESVYRIMKGARAQWEMENEIVKTLKNQDYNLEHNYGHGQTHLSINLMRLMFLVFLIDQTQERMCTVFQAPLNKIEQKIKLWEKMIGLFTSYLISDWLTFFNSIACGHIPEHLKVNSSRMQNP